MPAQEFDILIEQGATFEQQVTLRNVNGTPVDLTGWQARGQIRRTYRDEQPMATFTIAMPDVTTGVLVISLSSTETQALVATKALYDIEVTNDVGKIFRILQGTVTISPEVTK